MKRLLVAAIVMAASFCIFHTSEASIAVEGYATADNMLWVWDFDGAGNWNTGDWYSEPGYDNWQASNRLFGNAEPGVLDIFFAVKNDIGGYPAGPGNPAGLLASFRAASGYFLETGSPLVVTNLANWQIYTDENLSWDDIPGLDPRLDIDEGDWETPTSYGRNDDTTTIWNQAVGGPIANIDGSAEWIWADRNFSEDMLHFAIFRTRPTLVDPSAVPEPASLSLFGLGILGLFGLRKKSK